jgi:hypothetical protein
MNTNNTAPNGVVSSTELDDFRKGARAMFDALLFRAANNFHPAHQAACDKENELIESWAKDALEEVSPDDFSAWRAIADAYRSGFEAGKRASSKTEAKGPRSGPA